ncbi:hypothetical protein NQ317_007906 [Molorchus minor]|uniref:MADF domain-containing protein n=1 Tax=Molorchus minor TaxID=1323400 RepID=A0ABQ9JTJ1_9CUCU|nr:hypothetical protein NQ317_007906 [Molorchus minor]
MYSKWYQMSKDEKSVKAKELQSKWRNLRTCFRREWNKKNTPDDDHKKRRQYIYYDQLLFLLPVIDEQPTPRVQHTVLQRAPETEHKVQIKNLQTIQPITGKFSDVEKLEAKLEFLTTLKRITEASQKHNLTSECDAYTDYEEESSAKIKSESDYYLSTGPSTPDFVLSDASQTSLDDSGKPVSPQNFVDVP